MISQFFWKRGVKLTRLYVDAEVEENDGFVWRLTAMYGDPRSDHKDLT